jgi:hypothetical protein
MSVFIVGSLEKTCILDYKSLRDNHKKTPANGVFL